MTTTEALNKIHGATLANTYPDADMTSFGGWNVEDVVAFLRGASTVVGEDDAFTVDGVVTVLFAGDRMFVSGMHKP